ncbi:MAG: cytosolic protein [Desulfobacteraceae bacterium 4572_88]|nr:MAG: cytosolic protein [Desulfobacteraceae bacterium 4572_88]
MKEITQQQLAEYVEEKIPIFHENRLEKLRKLKLKEILKRKNPYLFKVKNITAVNDFIKTILDAYLSSQEESLFGGFLEELAIFVCAQVHNGRKSASEGIDLDFERDKTKYIVSVKSGPNWGNSSQIKRMKDNFKKARRILGTNTTTGLHVVSVNGCCYGKDNMPDKMDYLKLCGQRFWEFISGNKNLYTEIIEPLGHKAKEKNDLFFAEYSNVINKFSRDFMNMFCDSDGAIQWKEVIKFNSQKKK